MISLAIADRHDGVLIIDEAHATGVLGPMGRGLGAHLEGRDNIIALHTCGKALGAMGALLTGPQVMCDYLVNRSRPFIYATAPSPLMAAIVRAALIICRFDAARRDKLQSLVALRGPQARRKLRGAGVGLAHSAGDRRRRRARHSPRRRHAGARL